MNGISHKILIVDDEPLNIQLLKIVLDPLDYDIIEAGSGEEALILIREHSIDLILLDVVMPGMSGYDVCHEIKNNEDTRLIPVVMVTALDDTDAKVKGIEAGADDFITKPPIAVEIKARIKSLLRDNALNKKLASIENVIVSMASAVEAKNSYTEGHIQRVANISVALGKKIGLSKDDLEALWIGGILHDIGKIAVPENVLNKPGELNDEEFEIIKTHPGAGHKICLPLQKNLGNALDAVLSHHEKLDGSGYPNGIKNEDVSVLARIVGIADMFDAIYTDRPYRKGMSKEDTIAILRKDVSSGKIDGEIVEHLVSHVGL